MPHPSLIPMQTGCQQREWVARRGMMVGVGNRFPYMLMSSRGLIYCCRHSQGGPWGERMRLRTFLWYPQHSQNRCFPILASVGSAGLIKNESKCNQQGKSRRWIVSPLHIDSYRLATCSHHPQQQKTQLVQGRYCRYLHDGRSDFR